jgi:hypothetical protein
MSSMHEPGCDAREPPKRHARNYLRHCNRSSVNLGLATVMPSRICGRRLVAPLELAEFLRSDGASALARAHDVGRYVSLLETTRTSHSWVKDAVREVGLLRRYIRQVGPPLQFGDDVARDKAVHLKTFLAISPVTRVEWKRRLSPGRLKMARFLNVLAPSGPTDAPLEGTTPEKLEEWRHEAMAQTNYLQDELRLIRRSPTFDAR